MLLYGLFLMGFGIVAGLVVGHSVLGKLNRAAWQVKRPLRFQLSDFLWLMIQLQIAMGVPIGLFSSGSQVGLLAPVLLFAVLSVAVIWFAAIKTMSSAGVTRPKYRAAFVLVLLPGTLVLMMAVIVYATMLPALGIYLFEASLSEWRTYAIIGGAILLPLVWYSLRQLGRWILRGCEEAPVKVKPQDVAPWD